MSTQPEPLTAEELAEVRADHEGTGTCTAIQAWPCTHSRLLATLDESTAAARAEVARQVRELPWNVSGSTDDPEWAVSEYRDAVLALLEDAAPRQPDPSTHFVRGHEYCRSCDRDLTLGAPHRADCRAELDYPAAPRQPEPAHSTQCLAIGGGPGHDACVCYCHRTAGPCVVCGEPFPCPGFWQSGLPHRPAAPDTTTGTTDE